MKIKKIVIGIFIILLLIILLGIKKHEYDKRKNITIPVLLYHDFVTTVPSNDFNDFNYINTPQSFEENIKALIQNGYTVISLQNLNDIIEEKISIPEKPIIITFDDGYYSNYEYIYPIQKKYNIKTSIFVVTDKLGKEIDGIKYLGWNECLEMQNSGLVEIFSHSSKHVFYNKLPITELYSDIKKSYNIIEEKLGKKKFKTFAYPYGAYTKRAVALLKFSGIDMQLYDLGINNFKTFNKNYIKRINIPCEMTGEEIINEIENSK